MTEYGRIHTDGSRSGGQPVLKPCPFCGGEPKWYEGKFCASVKCDNGHAIHEYKPTLIEAIAAWNTRQPTQSDALREENEQLRHDLERLRVEVKAQYDRGYHEGCTHPLEQSK